MQISLEQLQTTPPPPTLFHYTSAEGLFGIVTTRSVWATVVHFLNDAQEFQHAIVIARQVLSSREHECATEREAKIFRLLSTSLGQVTRANVCAFSLTAQGDLLSQWRAYCPPGGGYSIGFSSARLLPYLQQERFWLVPCVYNADLQRELLHPIFDKAVRHFRNDGEETEERYQKEIAPEFLYEFTRIAPVMKHPAFQEEQEWRAVSSPIPFDRLRVRAARTLLIPYFALQLGATVNDFPLDMVTIGPHAHQQLAMAGVGHFLKKGSVGVSFIPYRDL